MFALMSQIAKGIITSFCGAIADIPAGWTLCDGTNGTRDLRDACIVGAGTSYAVGATGGATTHSQTADQAAHRHDIETGSDIAGGTGYGYATVLVDPAITVSDGSSLPPYFALAFIMKL